MKFSSFFRSSRLGDRSDDEVGTVGLDVVVFVVFVALAARRIVVFVVLGGSLVIDGVESVLDGNAQNRLDVVNHGDKIRVALRHDVTG